MNRYVSGNERKHLMRLGAIMVAADEAVAEYGALKNADKEMLKYIKSMGTFAFKALKVRMKHLDPVALAKLSGDTKNHVIVMKTRTEAAIEDKMTDAKNKVHPVNADDLLDLICITLERTCQVCKEASDTCRLKEILINAGIDPYDAAAPAGRCPYQYTEEGAEDA